MNYELVKELRNVGFQFSYCDEVQCHRETGFFGNGAEHYPILEELIEACGEIFCGIHKLQTGEWLAFIYDIEDSTRQVEERGLSPEEAVARLWLALNKKGQA